KAALQALAIHLSGEPEPEIVFRPYRFHPDTADASHVESLRASIRSLIESSDWLIVDIGYRQTVRATFNLYLAQALHLAASGPSAKPVPTLVLMDEFLSSSSALM